MTNFVTIQSSRLFRFFFLFFCREKTRGSKNSQQTRGSNVMWTCGYSKRWAKGISSWWLCYERLRKVHIYRRWPKQIQGSVTPPRITLLSSFLELLLLLPLNRSLSLSLFRSLSLHISTLESTQPRKLLCEYFWWWEKCRDTT